MKKDIIRKIWEIRGMIDKSIENQDMKTYDLAREKFYKIFKNEEHLHSISTSTIDYDVDDVEEMLRDREQNFAVLAFDVGENKRRVEGEIVDIEKFQFSSVLEVIWWSRWMLDNFVLNQKNGVKDEVNMKIFNAVETNLRETVNYYENFEDEVSKMELETLIELNIEAMTIYENLYGTKDNTEV